MPRTLFFPPATGSPNLIPPIFESSDEVGRPGKNTRPKKSHEFSSCVLESDAKEEKAEKRRRITDTVIVFIFTTLFLDKSDYSE
jgi:hypothetical protein